MIEGFSVNHINFSQVGTSMQYTPNISAIDSFLLTCKAHITN